MKFDSVKVQAFSAIEIPEFEASEPVEPDEPVVENTVIDLSTVEGYKASNNFGYDCPILQIGYNNVFLLGDIDLSKYSQIIIKYSYDGDTVVDKPVDQEWAQCGRAPIIGITTINKCFGYANVTNQDAIDAGFYTDLPHTSGSWAAATRTAVVDLTNVTYSGPCYVSAYNPWNREIAVVSVELVPVVETEPETPAVENLVIDMSTLGGAGYRADFVPAGYNAPLQLLGYGVAIDLGEIDLSKYSAVKITYGCDGGAGTEANFAAASSLAIGLKSTNTSYGQETTDNFDGDIAHTDMVFSSNGWASGAREAVVDLTAVDYNGNVWVAVHNPTSTEIAISAIEFIA